MAEFRRIKSLDFASRADLGEPDYDPVFYYYHSDHLGSAEIMTDRDGDPVQHYGYQPYGNERYRHNTSAFSVTNRFTGQQLDEDIGLYFYGSRYYDPALARFIQPDSVVPGSGSQSLNRYSYCYNNPLIFTDPTGNEPITLAMLAWSAIKGALASSALAAATGGDIGKAALSGALGGALGAGLGAFGDTLGGDIGRIVGSAAGGALGALVTGGDPGMAAATAAISMTTSMTLFGEEGISLSGGTLAEQFLKEFAASTGVGALAGGVTAEIFGGDFGEGAMWGAAGAASGYVVHWALMSQKEISARKLSAAQTKMKRHCESCYNNQNDIDLCKRDTVKIVAAIVQAWLHNYNRPMVSGGHRVGGYFCWDWEAAFYDAADSINSSYWDVSHGMLDNVYSDLVHYFIELSTRSGGGIVRIDDGFMGNTGFVHDRSWPGDPSWPITPWTQPNPAVPGNRSPFSYTYPRIEGVPGTPSGR